MGEEGTKNKNTERPTENESLRAAHSHPRMRERNLSSVPLTFVQVEAGQLALVLTEQAAGIEQAHQVQMGQTITQLPLQVAQTAVELHVQLCARSDSQMNGSKSQRIELARCPRVTSLRAAERAAVADV